MITYLIPFYVLNYLYYFAILDLHYIKVYFRLSGSAFFTGSLTGLDYPFWHWHFLPFERAVVVLLFLPTFPVFTPASANLSAAFFYHFYGFLRLFRCSANAAKCGGNITDHTFIDSCLNIDLVVFLN